MAYASWQWMYLPGTLVCTSTQGFWSAWITWVSPSRVSKMNADPDPGLKRNEEMTHAISKKPIIQVSKYSQSM